MLGFLEKMEENVKNTPDKIVLYAENMNKGLTFKQFYDLSGRIRRYLKNKGIGREDFVMICLPRGVLPVCAMYGVWRCGAAYVLVEDNYAKERIEYIYKDCGCKLKIDAEVFEEIQHLEPMDGYDKADVHDACYAVYTSGTTGNPKGVLHEYGNIERNIESLNVRNGKCIADVDERFAIPAPLNFVASALIIIIGLYLGATLYIMSYSTIKNPLAIGMYFLKNKITGTFLTPSYCKLFKKTPYFRLLIVGSEPASNIYFEGVDTFNLYTMSEGGFVVSAFLIDKKYEATPIGKPSVSDIDLKLITEDKTEAKDGEEGEIVYYNPYVRGYINLPEETEKAFKDHYYHTGDVAVKDENGNLVVCGRMNDMFKVNGNRVEPAEIEAATKKVLGVDWVAAKAIEDGDQIYIAAYYKDDIEVDFQETRKKLEEYLPYYMLPSYFVHIDEIPLKATGKFDRKALPNPKISDYKNEYFAPRDEVEEALCKAFEEALGIDKVGINDDFYQLGGDSLTSMDVLVKSKLRGLSTADIFSGHTPAEIAKLYKENHINEDGVSDEELDDAARKKSFPLLPYQLYMLDYQLYTPKSTMLNLFNLIRLDKEYFDMDRMCDSFNKAINSHPSLLTQFSFNNDGLVVQSLNEEYKSNAELEKISEAELMILKDNLVQPFRVIGSKLYRARVFETEKYGYIFFDVHHTVFDGTSFKVLMGDVAKAYGDMPIDRDFYYYLLDNQIKISNSKKYLEDRAYFEAEYLPYDKYSGAPKLDFHVRENTLDQKQLSLESNEEGLEETEKKYGISRNEFFITVALLSIAMYNREENINISWTYNGRDDLKKMTSTGLHLKDLPVLLRLNKKSTLGDIYDNIHNQVAKGIEHSSYPYTMIDSEVSINDSACLLYQQDIRDPGGDLMNIEVVDIRQNYAAAENIMDIQILDGASGLQLVIDYASSAYKGESIERFMKIFSVLTENLLKYAKKDRMNIKRILKISSKAAGENTWRIKQKLD